MVYTKKTTYRKRYRRRYYKRKGATYRNKKYSKKYHRHGRKNPNHVKVTRMRGTTPSDVVWQKFLYYENDYHFDLAPADKQLSQHIAINNPADPYTSLGGRMAAYFEKVMEMYRYCRVYAAKVTVRLTDVSGANDSPLLFALYCNPPDAPINTLNDYNDILSLPSNRCKVMKMFPNRVGGTRKLSFYITLADFFYFTRQQYENIIPSTDYDVSNFGGITGPTKLADMVLYYGRLNPSGQFSSETLATFGDVRIKFYCKVWGRIEFGEAQTTN